MDPFLQEAARIDHKHDNREEQKATMPLGLTSWNQFRNADVETSYCLATCDRRTRTCLQIMAVINILVVCSYFILVAKNPRSCLSIVWGLSIAVIAWQLSKMTSFAAHMQWYLVVFLVCCGSGFNMSLYASEKQAFENTLMNGEHPELGGSLPYIYSALRDLQHSEVFTEHISAMVFGRQIVQVQMIVQTISLFSLDFRHSLVVGLACAIFNTVLPIFDSHVDFSSAVQQMPHWSLHLWLVGHVMWCACICCAFVAMSWVADRNRRMLWAEARHGGALAAAARLQDLEKLHDLEGSRMGFLPTCSTSELGIGTGTGADPFQDLCDIDEPCSYDSNLGDLWVVSEEDLLATSDDTRSSSPGLSQPHSSAASEPQSSSQTETPHEAEERLQLVVNSVLAKSPVPTGKRRRAESGGAQFASMWSPNDAGMSSNDDPCDDPCFQLCSIWGLDSPAILEVCMNLLLLVDARTGKVRAGSSSFAAFLEQYDVSTIEPGSGIAAVQDHLREHLPNLELGTIYEYTGELSGSTQRISLQGAMLLCSDGADVVCCLKQVEDTHSPPSHVLKTHDAIKKTWQNNTKSHCPANSLQRSSIKPGPVDDDAAETKDPGEGFQLLKQMWGNGTKTSIAKPQPPPQVVVKASSQDTSEPSSASLEVLKSMSKDSRAKSKGFSVFSSMCDSIIAQQSSTPQSSTPTAATTDHDDLCARWTDKLG